jgi:hypothetical protein
MQPQVKELLEPSEDGRAKKDLPLEHLERAWSYLGVLDPRFLRK